MPRSKRARVVHESKTVKKSHKEQTRRLYANIREAIEKYDHLFVFAVDNMRNTYLKDVRTEFADSRLVPFPLPRQYQIPRSHTLTYKPTHPPVSSSARPKSWL